MHWGWKETRASQSEGEQEWQRRAALTGPRKRTSSPEGQRKSARVPSQSWKPGDASAHSMATDVNGREGPGKGWEVLPGLCCATATSETTKGRKGTKPGHGQLTCEAQNSICPCQKKKKKTRQEDSGKGRGHQQPAREVGCLGMRCRYCPAHSTCCSWAHPVFRRRGTGGGGQSQRCLQTCCQETAARPEEVLMPVRGHQETHLNQSGTWCKAEQEKQFSGENRSIGGPDFGESTRSTQCGPESHRELEGYNADVLGGLQGKAEATHRIWIFRGRHWRQW